MTTTRALRTTRAPAVGLAVSIALVVLAVALPPLTGWYVHVHSVPPLHADWDPRVGWGTVPAVAIGALGARRAVDLAERLAWRRLLLVVFLGGLVWLLALAFVDGSSGVSAILQTQYEYLRTARATTDVHATLEVYVGRIRQTSPHYWPTHIAGHPPGALLFFVALVRLGLGSGFAAGLVVTVLAATTAVAVMVTLRTLGAVRAARRAAPFLVLGPAAVWQCVSADAMFAAVGAWGVACLAIAATRRSAGRSRGRSAGHTVGWSVLAGLLLGYCQLLSYGLPLLGIVAVAVLVAARTWRPLVPAAVAALAVVAAFWVAGFDYLDALAAVHDRYWDAIGGRRPASYWLWADLAVLSISAGPLAGAAVAQLAVRAREPGTRVVALLAGAGVAMVLVADLSLMSKAEVERIWLPFVPWILVACALLPERWRRRGLVLQVVVALAVQHLLATGW